MSIRVAHIWRHPIKGIGCEACQQVDLSPDGAVIGDRAWALLNADAPDIDDWQPRRNFFQVASGPMLSPVIAQTQGDKITLRHPDKAPLTINPETDGQVLRDWVAGLWPQGRPGPARLVRAPVQGMTDVDFPSVSIGNLASLKALSDKIGTNIDMRRFRINLWLDGMEPWSEGELLSGDIRLGNAQLTPVDPIER
ncbi:MAG: MOSC N-terminal beta barrel domain-containing protein, partial [Pseudomonadota bacterium]